MKTINLESGNKIIIGQCASENSNLVHQYKEIYQGNLWFHLHGQPSCHVILTGTGNFTKEEIRCAAEACKAHSKLKAAPVVTVSYLEIKYVRLTRTPGLVTLLKKPTLIKV